LIAASTGVGRVVKRACDLMKQDPNEDARNQGGIDLDTVQRYVNHWYSSSLDLFGGENVGEGESLVHDERSERGLEGSTRG
jgi:benzoyl-CoA 2,3-dioxygenase component B